MSESGWVGPMEYGEIVERPGDPQTVRLSDLRPPHDPFAEFLTDLRDRVIAIEARQRLHGQHDPGCPVVMTVEEMAAAGTWYAERRCNCWLSKPEVIHIIADGGRLT